jgi:DNA-binding transcriptional ArsR family regulator
MRHSGKKRPPADEALTTILDCFSHAEHYGERYLEALRAYHAVFFAEEEARIRPALHEALVRAQALAKQQSLPDLLETISQGLRIDDPPDAAEVVLAPSYWGGPYLTYGKISPEREIWLFGARPPDASLVPGQLVPDALLRPLKALSDPTRLRILRYLSEEPLTPAELARRLRLRAPTVTHHMQTLRLAGLVQVTISVEQGRETRHYATRREAISAAWKALEAFTCPAPD